MIVQSKLKSRFQEYSKVPTSSGLSDKEIAGKKLQDNSIYDVKVTSVDGLLSDYYNPTNKAVNLSPDIFDGCNVSAAALAPMNAVIQTTRNSLFHAYASFKAGTYCAGKHHSFSMGYNIRPGNVWLWRRQYYYLTYRHYSFCDFNAFFDYYLTG